MTVWDGMKWLSADRVMARAGSEQRIDILGSRRIVLAQTYVSTGAEETAAEL